ncbi:MAG: hypothetical protein ACR2P6_04940 [Gammaproteobacteria bacterium]
MSRKLFISIVVVNSFFLAACTQNDTAPRTGEVSEPGIVDLDEAAGGVGDDMDATGDSIVDIAEDHGSIAEDACDGRTGENC